MKYINFNFNFISSNVSTKDIEDFFCPLDGSEIFYLIQPHYKLYNVMYLSGIFSSLTQAKKNGWDKEIPKGYSEYIVGKNKRKIYILNL